MSAARDKGGAAASVRVGIVGTGYIADFHAKAIDALDGVELVAVADANLTVAQAFGAAWNVPAYASLDAMVEGERLDAIHLLTPPDLHYPIAVQAFAAGLDVLVEKPMCVSSDEAARLRQQAEAADRLLCVNHSMIYGESYVRLRDHVRAGDIGPVDYLSFNHFAELGFIRSGPFGNWMLREPGNVFLEIGSHPVSGMIDLVGSPERLVATADRDVILPGGARAYRRWRMQATAGRTAVDINLDLGPGFPQRTVTARGALGTVIADLDADTCVLDRRTDRGLDFDRYDRSLRHAAQLKRQARHTLADYILTKAKVRKRGNPYEKSIFDSVKSFYAGRRSPDLEDSRISVGSGQAVVDTCRRVIESADVKNGERSAPAQATSDVKPTVLVIGGTGFIGKRLISQLVAKGYGVRAAGRSISPVLLELGQGRLENMRMDMRSPDDLKRALDGIDVVYHLATSDAKLWPDYLEREVEPSRAIGEACLAAGVKRLIYTGTIDSYYAGKHAGSITEETPLDPKIERRNYYARAKAASERLLMNMHRERGLPVVIARPGIVIGKGGNPFHWGVGTWRSEGVCEVWGDGHNPLPLVLVDDVAAGLVRAMEVPDIEGRSYNLVDAGLMSARDYLDTLQKLAGMRIDISYRSISSFYLEDMSKWTVKVAVGHPDASRRPSYRDWESRTQKATFDCSRTRAELSWSPASDVDILARDGIGGSLESWLSARS